MPFHGGLDWGATSHAACVLDGAGQIVARVEARHDAGGLAELLARLRAVAPPAELPVAIERPSGLIVDALVAAGHPVVPIHPNVVKACRPRYRAAGGKSDPGDAYMLADVLRTDGHRFRPLTPVSDEIKALRALVRARDDLVTQRVALANQLRSLLEGFWPGAAAIFAAIDSLIALAFIGRYPTPESAGRLGEKRLASFMAQHGYCGRRSAAELLARLRAAPTGFAREAQVGADVGGPSGWPACGPPRPAWPARPRRRPKARSRAPWPACSNGSSPRSPSCRRAPSGPSLTCRTAGSSCRSRAPAASARPRSWPRSATCASASRPRTSSPPRPASVPSPTRPARAAASCSGGPATRTCAEPSPASPTTPATPPLGRQPSTARPAPAAASTPTPSASSPEPGYVSSGAPGRAAAPTILSGTPALRKSPPDDSGLDAGYLTRSPGRKPMARPVRKRCSRSGPPRLRQSIRSRDTAPAKMEIRAPWSS